MTCLHKQNFTKHSTASSSVGSSPTLHQSQSLCCISEERFTRSRVTRFHWCLYGPKWDLQSFGTYLFSTYLFFWQVSIQAIHSNFNWGSWFLLSFSWILDINLLTEEQMTNVFSHSLLVSSSCELFPLPQWNYLAWGNLKARDTEGLHDWRSKVKKTNRLSMWWRPIPSRWHLLCVLKWQKEHGRRVPSNFLYFQKDFFSFMYMCLCEWMSQAHRCPQRTEDSIGYPGGKVTWSCKLWSHGVAS